MAGSLRLTLDRRAATTLSEQIRRGIIAAIESGSLPPGTRLPSWRDLASQLGVARGTVRAAYDRLSDEQWVVSMRPGGTRVAPSPARKPLGVARDHVSPSAVYQEIVSGPATFQMGVPSSDS
ncbi:winged helix-turn-helix domain-containing protein, partial [Lysobacter soli]|uniref:winged helix-turn-helix domain-containing protein n=1 Tax=Lysobacter soli TaxID=453783 RepID=UPI00240FB591